MANLRVRDFETTLTPTQKSDLQGLFLWVDKAGFSDAQKVDVISLLTDSIITDNNNDYQALTPKAFYDSVMTNGRRGVGIFATDADVADKDGTGVLNTFHQILMQAQWLKDWFQGNGTVIDFKADNEDMELAQALAYSAAWSGDFTAGQLVELQPAGISSRPDLGFIQVFCTISLSAGATSYYGTFRILSSTSPGLTTVQIQSSGFYIAVTQNGLSFGVYNASARTDVRISITVNGTLR